MISQKILKLYVYVDGNNDIPFYGDSVGYRRFITNNGYTFTTSNGLTFNVQDLNEQIEIGEFRYDAKRMGGAPTITASVSYPTCLDDVWTDMVYTELNGERYFLKQTPTSSKSNDDARYKHDLIFVAERAILDNAYFYDAVVGKPLENDKPVTNSTKFHFYGNVEEFVRKLNHSLQYTSLQEIDEDGNVLSGYHVVLDEDIVTRDDKQISFDGVVFSQALQECYNQFGIPYYFDGKTIHVGFTNNVISDILEYGVDGALLSATKTNANFKVINRATGYGSTDNIPYYYPNNAPKGEIKISTTGSITPEDVEIMDADRFNQLRAGDTYTFKGDITANEEQLSVVLPSITQQIPFIDGEATVKKLYIENDSVDVNIRYDFTFDAAAESNIELSWQLANCANPSFNMTPPLKTAFGKDHLELEVKRVVFSNDEESYEIPFEPTTIKHTYYSDIVYRSGQTSTGKVASKLIQTGITFSTPNIHGGASVVIEAKLKTLGKNFWSQVPDYYWGEGSAKKPYSDIVFTAYVDTHVTGSWRDANDELVNMKYYGVNFLKNPQYGDTLRHDIVKYVNTSTNLQPSIYRATDGKERFYNAINYPFAYVEGYELKYGEYVKDGEVHNDAYIDDKGNYYEFTNEYKEGRPREHVFSVDDIKPTIKEATNDISWMEEDEEGEMKQVFQRIDMFSEFAYNIGDNDETYIDPNGNTSYKHPYFFAKLRKLDFNLFDHASENGAMTISMTSGHAGACNFEIGVSKEEPQFNPVQVYEQDEVIDGVLHKKGSLKYDKNGYVRCGLEDWQDVEWPQDVQQDTVNNEVWIALKKEDSTYGFLMPKAPRYEEGELVSAGHRPVACSSAESNDGDTFVILNINLPEEYIYKAEKKLEKAIVKYIWENNVEKFNFSVNFSRIFLEENQDILHSLNENARLSRVKYNGNEYVLYVSSYSYSMNSGDVLPEIRIELDDTLTISQNALQEAINAVKSDIANAINAMDVAAIGSRYFLRKDTYDVAEAPIDFRGGVYFGEGGDVSYYEDGSAKLTIDYLEVTKRATFTSLEIQEKTHAGGQILLTPAAMICNRVEETEDAYRCYFQNVGENGEEIYNQFIEGDQAISQTFNEWGGHYYWRLVTAVSEDYVDLSKTDCTPESDIPKVGDKIIQLGHRNLEDRQNAIIIAAYGDDSPYIIQYKGINAFELTDDKIVTKLSSTENIFTGKVHMELGSDGLDTLPEWIEVRADYQSLKYIQNAFEGATDVLGGLVLTKQIQVGDYDTENKEWVKMNGGMSGVYESDNDVAFWAGGDFEKAVETAMTYEENPTYQPTEQELAAMANFVITHGGRAILNEAIVRGSVYANEGNFGQGCTIGDTVRVVDGGIEIDSHVNDIEGEIRINESNGISCSNTKFYALLGGSGCSNTMLSVGTVSSGGVCPNNPTPIIVSGDTDAIYCHRGSFAGLRPKCCHIDELYYNGGYYLRDDIFSVLFPSSGTYNLNLDDLFVGNLNHPVHGQEMWLETMGANINVTSTIPMWAHYAAQYQTSHTFSSSGVIRFKYYGAFNGQPNGIWTYSWVETK